MESTPLSYHQRAGAMTSEQLLFYALLAVMAFFYLRKQLLARGIQHYTGPEAKKRMSEGSILLDVRTKSERQSVSIPSSLHIPLNELSSRMKDLEKYRGKEIICFCASGSRSVSAGITLKKAGFTVGNLSGGIASWNF